MYCFIPKNEKIALEYLNENRGWLHLAPGEESFRKKRYQQGWVHWLFNEIYLTFHSNFSLI